MATRKRNRERSHRPLEKSSLPKPKRYEGIGFHFLSPFEDTTLTGSVLIRKQEMVLDIRDPVRLQSQMDRFRVFLRGALSNGL
jgi:hypothetical protein